MTQVSAASAQCPATLQIYAPESDKWAEFVRGRIPDLAAVFADAYQLEDRGRHFHSERILHSRAWLFAVEDEDGRLVAASYVFQGGRRAASGVVRSHQQHGHYTDMVEASVRCAPHQFTEVLATHSKQRRALESCGFHVQIQWPEVKKLLGPLLEPLVLGVRDEGGELTYVRRSFDGEESREYLLMQHGNPRPVVQAVPYYKQGLDDSKLPST
jgi:hypothetical protein